MQNLYIYDKENNVNQTSLLNVPIGTVLSFAANTPPDTFSLCDDSAINRETYSDLFSIIGTAYGAGNGSTTFNLPNLVGRFIEGHTAAGTYIGAGLPNITGQVVVNGTNARGASGAISILSNGSGAPGSGSSSNWDYWFYFDASRSSSIYGKSSTVQPPAVTMIYIIKAYDTVLVADS